MTLLGDVLVALGVLLFVLAAVGIVRLPDVYARLNATTKAAALGIVLVLLGALLLLPEASTATTVKVLLAVVLQLATAPVGAYAIARSTYRAGVPLWRHTRYDELAEDEQRAAGR